MAHRDALLCVVGAVLLVAARPGGAHKHQRLVFEDNFDSLDETKWGHMVSAWRGGNNEFQYYRNHRNNSYVRDGVLYIRPTFTADEFGEDFLNHGTLSYPDCNMEPCVSQAGNEIVLPVQSARLSTSQKFSFEYGRLEVRARLPRGDWLWPAIWLYPQGEEYGGWPRSGEIDLVESRGNAHLTDSQGRHAGIRYVGSTLHFGPSPDRNAFYKTHYSKVLNSDTLADDFHVYTLEWDRGGFRFLVDGEVIGERSVPEGGFWGLGGFQGADIWPGSRMAPFDKKFYIILNLAVGGTFFGDDLRNSPYPRPWNMSSGRALRQFWENRALWKDTWDGERTALRIDYVRVWQ